MGIESVGVSVVLEYDRATGRKSSGGGPFSRWCRNRVHCDGFVTGSY